ncbi:MAG: hypothetical protein ACRDIV_21300 [Ktedonobacteraceae bacterium]
MAERIVANPGSTLGEAIGTLIELEVNRLLRPIAEENGYVYVTAGPANIRTGRPTKLLLKDSMGNEFQIDSVIANTRMQPLVLIESKYTGHGEHNGDEDNLIYTAHYSLRRTFPTIRKSIVIVAGNWNGTPNVLMESFDISLFEVGFPKIVSTLAEYGVDIDWKKKEREKAVLAWEKWSQLNEIQYQEIAHKLLADIGPELRESMKATLDTAISREVNEVKITIETNLDEPRRNVFDSIDDAIEFLEAFDG